MSLCLRYARGSSGDRRDGFVDENREARFTLLRKRRKKGEGRKDNREKRPHWRNVVAKLWKRLKDFPPPFPPHPPLLFPFPPPLSSPFLSLPFFFF